MLRSRTSGASKAAPGEAGTSTSTSRPGTSSSASASASVSRAQRRKNRHRAERQSTRSSGIITALICLGSFAMACLVTKWSYSRFLTRLSRNRGMMAAGGDSSLIGNNGGAVHTVKTKHLRKHPKNEENAQNNNHQHHHHHAKNEKYNKYSEEEIEEIVEQRADDIVPVDSIYSMTYPSINHIHGMDTGGVNGRGHGHGHGHGQGQGFKDELFPLSDIAGHIALVINVASE
uniref:Uncharacterized protein n=1 Tax=Chaetoceros debilis TaxID=122233 RepID=A0A7S3Q6G4_9STRA